MPYPFLLPTTSSYVFTTSFESSSHPSLPLAATTHRGVLRDALKKHKRLPPSSRASNLSGLLQALDAYLPYLLAIDAGLSSNAAGLDVVLAASPLLEWRPVLTSSHIPGREQPRLKLQSLEYEIAFALSTLAYTQVLLSRSALHPLYSIASSSPSPEVRTAAIQSATKSLLLSASIHAHISNRLSTLTSSTPPPSDLSPNAHAALSSLAHAEATLLAVLKDDPYPSSLSQSLNKNDRDWMIKAPTIPKVRAHLFARLCLAASEHVAKAAALLRSSGKVDDNLLTYCEDLRVVGKAKACRFFGVDAELGGETGTAIAWLQGAKSTLRNSPSSSISTTPSSNSTSSPSKFSLSKLKSNISTKLEEKRVATGGDWGLDGGVAEESRVVDYLLSKWQKMNDTIGTQVVPPEGPLLSSMPTGRDIHAIPAWKQPSLEPETLRSLRAVPGSMDLPAGASDGGMGDSSDEEGGLQNSGGAGAVVGAFPGTRGDYAGSGGYY